MGVLLQSTMRQRQELAAVSALRGTHAGTGGSFGGRAKAQSDGVVSWSVGRLWATSGIIDDEIDETGAAG